MGQTLYADLILPLAFKGLLTYEVPSEMNGILTAGMLVMVQAGKTRRYPAIVSKVHNKRPDLPVIKPIIDISGETRFVTDSQLELWRWVSEYYMCTRGEVMKAAIPAGVLSAGKLLMKEAKPKRKRSVSSDHEFHGSVTVPAELSAVQQSVMESIVGEFSQKSVVLLHGVTSSGKTEIYFHLIAEELKQGRQVLYLLPEIALTTQLIERINRHFGDTTVVYHSRLGDRERVETWQKISGKHSIHASLVVGVRSSVFLPFANLGLIIVDEEHDGSYKQNDPAPRYNARDTAVVLASMNNARVLLASATPSVETYYNALSGKYGLAELKVRHGEVELPEIVLADTRTATRRKEMVSHFSPELVASIDGALSLKEQVMLFRNRRGFSPYLECSDCGWIPSCTKCSVRLTYHKRAGRVVCHYCGHSIAIPQRCEACSSTSVSTVGFGTEKIEDELRMVFPNAAIERLDQDTSRKKDALSDILGRFERGETDILVGTQMISKGLDFENLTVVGILNADSLLNYPDFRAYERSFQMMEQVSGRSGRRSKKGRVVIQCSNPGHEIIQMVLRHDYRAMYEMQMEEREIFGYPPFTRLIRIDVRHRDMHELEAFSDKLASDLRRFFGNRIMGPEYPPVARVQSMYIRSLLIKLEKDKPLNRARKYIEEALGRLMVLPRSGTLRITIDVDPL
jgi:primosomal protein N' (replication factor Y) (superfamily II helicase)